MNLTTVKTFLLFSLATVWLLPSQVFAKGKTHTLCFKTTGKTGALVRAGSLTKQITMALGKCKGPRLFKVNDLNGGKLENNDVVTIKTNYDRYFRVDKKKGKLTGDAKKPKKWEKFTLIRLKNGNVRLKSAGGKFVSRGKFGGVNAKQKKAGKSETFELIKPAKSGGLLRCLQNLPKKYQPISVLKMAKQAHGDPAKFTKNFYNTYVKTSLKSANAWTKNEVLTEFEKKYPFGVKPGSKGWAKKLLTTVTSKVDSLGKKKGLEPLGCMVKHVLKPMSKKLEKHVVSAMENLSTKMTNLWDKKVKGKLKDKIEKVLIERFEKLVSSSKRKDLDRIASFVQQAARKHTMKQQKRINEKLEAYDTLLSSKSSKQAKKAYGELQKLLKKELTPDDMAKIAGDAMARYVTEKVFEWRSKHLDPLLEKALDVISSLLTTAEQNFTGYCGLIPEVGGIICSHFSVATHMTWDWVVRPSLMDKGRSIFNQQTKALVKKARDVMEYYLL